MPKSSKKRKDKAADFSVLHVYFSKPAIFFYHFLPQKAKLKLGKGKQVANNAVDTSFKARGVFSSSPSVPQFVVSYSCHSDCFTVTENCC